MEKQKTSFYDRLVKNWKTTSAAIVALAVAVGVWFGTDIDPQSITIVLGAIYGVLLLFAKD